VQRLLRGRTRAKELDRLGEHLACCAECRSRYDMARREMAAVSDVAADRPFHPPTGTVRILLRHMGVAALVVSIIALTIAMGRQPLDVREKPTATSHVARGTASETAVPAAPSLLDAQTLVRSLHAFDNYPPNRAAAYTIGLLREYGVPLSSTALAFRAATILVTEPGDTWESAAAKSLGDPALWPMIVLLNLEKTQDGEFVPPGTYLRVPQLSLVEGSP
jgi:nucleoid-associated protein YgaU